MFRIALVTAALVLAACSRRPNDELITAHIQANFFSDSELKLLNLRVGVQRGKVTLGGIVPSAEARLKAFKLALYTEGVTTVQDEMEAVAAPLAGSSEEATPVPSAPKPERRPETSTTPAAEPAPAAPEPAPVVSIPVVAIVQPPAVSIPVAVPAPESASTPAPVPAGYPEGGVAAVPVVEAVRVPVSPRVVPSVRPPSFPEGTTLTGAGAVFPGLLYQVWFREFQKTGSHVRIRYQTAGSGSGILQLTRGQVDFVASDVPMNDSQISASYVPVLHFPTVVGGVVVTSNVPGVRQLNFTGELLARIFSGQVTKWNDPAVARWNPSSMLPDLPIVVVHRSDSTAATLTFTSYLASQSTAWRESVGAFLGGRWLVGLAGAQNAGVAEIVRQTPGSIGYLDLTYALQNQVALDRVRNGAGVFVEPKLIALTAAAAAKAAQTPADLRVSLVDAPGRDSYPIAFYTWLIAPARLHEAGKARALAEFLGWMTATGEASAASLGYAPLPPEIAARAKQQAARLQ
jgi:phosphate transport system substrate-binding protein